VPNGSSKKASMVALRSVGRAQVFHRVTALRPAGSLGLSRYRMGS
jgi:hypothetical protein